MGTSQQMIDALLAHCNPNLVTLEPSAGNGDISSELAYYLKCTVDVCELNKEKAKILSEQDLYRNVFIGDFLKLSFPLYDQIVAVPPYKNNIDCQHIMKMHDLLKPGGKLISFTLPYWIVGFYENQVNFRNWLKNKQYTIELLEDKSYVSCPKMLLIMQK